MIKYYVADTNNPLNVYINGTKVPDGTNYRDIRLNAHDEIAIVYGTPPSKIPSIISFQKGYDHMSIPRKLEEFLKVQDRQY